ncbi:hypothetical protein [Microbacterium amylolyticum]|uniref:DNA uptake lipoprotein n=1 Tax=Microbacterium amylolyticum TaxID=936337 RepID=A0ABS4ZG41_9MICO|nr:hypothetical protein [Microbacterium amylolyticum]MBP2436187.1 hypothetical protein [Microbacterium amylolyticum]
MTDAAQTAPARSRRMTGLGTVLVFLYAVMALAATGRSVVQIIERFAEAPVPYTLSAAAAIVYVLATVALLVSKSPTWYRIAWIAVCFELAGVLIVGTLSWAVPDIFHAEATVWTLYGSGYFWVPLVLPFLGIWWLVTHRPPRAV